MALPPFTHHEILALVEPFTRQGRALDLAASDRMARRLQFKPLQRADALAGAVPLTETLQLDNPAPGQFRLTRMLTLDDGLQARLVADGPQPATLLARIGAVPPQRQFRLGAGHALACSHRLPPVAAAAGVPAADAGPAVAAAQPALALELTEATLRVPGLRLALAMPTVRGAPAEVLLCAPPGEPDNLDLPQDLLAVLGWPWARLERLPDGWRGQLRLARRADRRGPAAEQQLALAAEHLARTLAEPPLRFHQRLWLARWRVTLRRAVPALVSLGLIAGAAAVPRFGLGPDSVALMLLLNAPPVLLLLFFFGLRDIPRIEIPPLPRASRAPAWRRSPDAAAGPAGRSAG